MQGLQQGPLEGAVHCTLCSVQCAVQCAVHCTLARSPAQIVIKTRQQLFSFNKDETNKKVLGKKVKQLLKLN